MAKVEELLQKMRIKHDALGQRLAMVPESQMGTLGAWGEQQMPIRSMFYRFISHEVEHTIQAAKTLRDLGIVPDEARLILGLLHEAQGKLEGLLVAVTDDEFDQAPQGEWSLREVLEHIIKVEDIYAGRIEQALAAN